MRKSIIKTLSITNQEADQRVEIGIRPFLVTNPSDLKLTTETWGVDEVPMRFETMTRIVGGEAPEIKNKLENTIDIKINNRFSLYHDHLEYNPRSSSIVGLLRVL